MERVDGDAGLLPVTLDTEPHVSFLWLSLRSSAEHQISNTGLLSPEDTPFSLFELWG